MRRLARPLVISACLLVLGLSGCLGSEERSSRVKGDTLIVYSSLPATGVSSPAARAMGRGERLALSEAGGRVMGLRVGMSMGRRVKDRRLGGVRIYPFSFPL